MTTRGVRRIEADGTHVYWSGNRYKPLAPEDRKNGVNKPDHPEAVRFHGDWFTPLELVAEEQRVLPETRSDEEAYEHMGDRRGRGSCGCDVCRRPPEIIGRWQRKWQRDMGLRS